MTWFLYPPTTAINQIETTIQEVKKQEKEKSKKFWLYALAGAFIVFIILKMR